MHRRVAEIVRSGWCTGLLAMQRLLCRLLPRSWFQTRQQSPLCHYALTRRILIFQGAKHCLLDAGQRMSWNPSHWEFKYVSDSGFALACMHGKDITNTFQGWSEVIPSSVQSTLYMVQPWYSWELSQINRIRYSEDLEAIAFRRFWIFDF